MPSVRFVLSTVLIAAVIGGGADNARAQHHDGAELVRLLGTGAKAAFAPPEAPGMGAIVRLPSGVRASDLGLSELAPGFGRVWGTPSLLISFADAHPELR